MAFGFFKKKKQDEDARHYDPNNIRITDIRVGFMFEYDALNWEVKEEYEYDWGDNEFSYEFLIRSGEGEEYTLSMEEEGELEITLFKQIRIAKLGDVDEEIVKNERPPREITYEGITYYRDGEYPGFYRNTATTERSESIQLMSWTYYDDDEKRVLSIEQFGEREFEAYVGTLVKEYEFSNILPASN